MTVAFSNMYNKDLGRISRGLQAVGTSIIGDDTLVHIRRTITDLRDDVLRFVAELDDNLGTLCYSGSKAEGLRFKSSDEDWMVVYRKIRVLPSDIHAALYDNNTELLQMENEMTKPGFTLLKMTDNSTSNFRLVNSKKIF